MPSPNIIGSEFCPHARHYEPEDLGDRAECIPAAEPVLGSDAFGAKIFVSRPNVGEAEIDMVAQTMRETWVSGKGPYVQEFEKRFSAAVGAKHAVAVNSGAGALTLVMAALGVKPGDEIIVPTFTMISSVNCFAQFGAVPVFVDCDEHYQLRPDQVTEALTHKTKAILAVHIYGHPVDCDAIEEIGKLAKVPVIYDTAEAHGARYKNEPIGGRGLASIYSFFGNKIVTTGEGGMVTTNNEEFASLCRNLADVAFSSVRHFWHYRLGFNFRMSSLQAAMGVAQVKRFSELLSAHQYNRLDYARLLQSRGTPGVKFQPEAPWAESASWMIGVEIDRDQFGMSRCRLREYLATRGVETRTYFIPMHLQPLYFNKDLRFPKAEQLCRDGLYLPSSSTLNDDEREYVIELIHQAHVSCR